jgi:uncharacterized protein
VDLVIERDDGLIVGVEVKAGSRVLDKDLTELRILKSELGEAFVAGAVLHTGPRAYTAEDRVHVLPADRLWVRSKGEQSGGLPGVAIPVSWR